MIINVPEVKRTIDDFEFVFETGMMLPFSLDLALGDTIEITETQALIDLVARPSKADPTKFIPAEDTTIFLNHVVSIQHRKREVVELTPEQKHGLAQTWLDLAAHPTVQ